MQTFALLLLTVCLITGGNSSFIQDSISQEYDVVPQKVSESDLEVEPVYQPRFFGLWGGGGTTVENKTTVVAKTVDADDDDDDNVSGVLGVNATLEILLDVLQNSGNASLQENLLNLASAFGGNGTVGKISDLLKNSQNKSLQENLMNVLSNTSLSKFVGNETINNIIGVLQNPGNKTLQENLLNIATNAALSKFGDNEAITSIANALKNSGNKTLQENLISVATEAALGQFGDNEAVKNIANVLKNSGNKTLQENLMNVATEAALSQFGDNEAIQNIANVLKNSGNKTIQENLLNVATEAALTKFGHNEAVQKIVEVMRNPGNQSIAQNVLSLAADLATSKFKNNAIIKSVANILQSRNSTVQEKLTAAADAALTTTLGPVGAAVAKQGINALGQALKLGGGFFGGLLKTVGGNTVLGKVGDAIAGGTSAMGGLMTTIASGPQTNSTVAAIESSKAAVVSEEIGAVAQVEVAKIEESLKPTEEKKAAVEEFVKEGVAVINEVATILEKTEESTDNKVTTNYSKIQKTTQSEESYPTVDSSTENNSLNQGTSKMQESSKSDVVLATSSPTVGKSIIEDSANAVVSATNGVEKLSGENAVTGSYGTSKGSNTLSSATLQGHQNSFTQGNTALNPVGVQGGNYLGNTRVGAAGTGQTTNTPVNNYGTIMNYGGENSGKAVSPTNGKPINIEITTVKIHMGK